MKSLTSVTNIVTLSATLIILLFWTGNMQAAQGAGKPTKKGPAPPDLTNGGKIDQKLQWTLGSTGARGWIYAYEASTEHARQICVTKVHKGSPADGVLKEGDVILGIMSPDSKDGTGSGLFTSDPRKALSAAITEAEKEENKGILALKLWRPFDPAQDRNVTKTITVTLPLTVMGSFSETAPYDCEKSRKIIEMAVDAIKEDGLDNGNPNPVDGDGIPGIINALGLMATGRADVMPMVKAKMQHIAKEPVDGMNWGHAWSLLGLAEYHLLTGDASVLPAIERYAVETARGQSRAGTWGHESAGDDGILIGYGAMNQLSITHMIGLILATKCGVKAPVVNQAIAKSLQFFNYYVGKGGIPYGAHAAVTKHGPDDNGKSSGVAVAFNLAGNKKGTEFLSRFSVYDFSRIEIGHASNFFHLNWQSLGSAQLGPEAAAAHLKQCQWYYDLLRDWRGKFRFHKAPGKTEPGKYWDATGARLLYFCLPLKTLYLTGKGGYIADEVRGKELEAIVESGRYDGHYHTLSDEQLLTRLTDWCHATRYRAAEELAKRDGDWCAKGLELYKNGTMQQKYGASRLFEALKDKAAPAVDTLAKNVTHPDLWLRIRTVHALGAIGKPADMAVPALLDAALLDDAADDRNMFRRAISLVLFNRKNGLLKDDEAVAAAPRETLITALKALLRIESGLAVTFLQHPLKQLTFEELKPLWPEIVYRVEHRLSENVMGAKMQPACLNLLADHKVEEGLQLAGYMLMTQNIWDSSRRNKITLNALRKYGTHAKQTFFPLETYLQRDIKLNPEVEAFKHDINSSTGKPELVSIAPYLGDYEIGGHYRKLVTMRKLRTMIATDNLAEYWKAYETVKTLLELKPDWKRDTDIVLDELMSIPRASDIIGAHLAINEIKQAFIDKTITREAAIKQLQEYVDTYNINKRGPNLVYWFGGGMIGKLKAGKDLK